MSMTIRVVLLTAGLLAAALLVSCERVFTYSPLKPLQREASSLPAEQQVEFAQTALGSGDTAAMESAYTAVEQQLAQNPPSDPTERQEMRSVATDLAIELSGIEDAVFSLVPTDGSIDEGTVTEEKIVTALQTVDTSYADKAADQIKAMEADGRTAEPVQYAMAGTAKLAKVAKEIELPEVEEGEEPQIPELTDEQQAEVEEAVTFLSKASETMPEDSSYGSLLTDFGSFFGGEEPAI
jgi:hypothetical protein